MASLTQDSRSASTLTQDNRTSTVSLTQDSKTVGDYLWSANMYPWQMDFPWLWAKNGVLINMDDRTT